MGSCDDGKDTATSSLGCPVGGEAALCRWLQDGPNRPFWPWSVGCAASSRESCISPLDQML